MRKILPVIAIILVGILALTFLFFYILSLVSARPMYRETLDQNFENSSTIYHPDRALTFARYRVEGKTQLLLVSSYKEGILSGVNLTKIDPEGISDPIRFFQKYGYLEIMHFSERYDASELVLADDLILPAEFSADNVAVGYNYLSHTEELDEEEPPFLYPKKVRPTAFNSTISVRDYTLPDYELELGFVVLEDLERNKQDFDYLGFMLVNDFSDREPIVRKHVQVAMGKIEALPDGIQGYPEAKNKEGAFPVGNLLLIPKDYTEFLENLEFKLYMNEDLRQVAEANQIIWGPEKCVEEIFNRSDWVFNAGNEEWHLMAHKNRIPTGTIILSGTPQGVIFKKANMWNRSVFLKEGDQILMQGDGFGFITNSIVE